MSFMQMLFGTPTWVWVALGYCVFLGIRAFKPSTKSFWKTHIVAAIFLALGLRKLYSNFFLGWSGIAVWSASALIGAGIGWFIILSQREIQVDRVKGLIHLPSDKTVLPIILSIFAVKYYFGYMSAVHPELATALLFNLSNLATNALLTGMLVGKTVHLTYAYFTLPQLGLREE